MLPSRILAGNAKGLHHPEPDGKLTRVRVFILTGAGVSAESGLPTFRGADGLWEGHRIEDVATPEAFQRHPQLVQDFYNARRRALGTARPNDAHRAVAAWQQAWPGAVTLVTQNVDDLHERAGSPQVIHLHGELRRVRCLHCHAVTPWAGDLGSGSSCSSCGIKGRLRPHIVWFGEMPLELEAIGEALARADLFVAAGTSGQVYPAAGFAGEAAARGLPCIEVNPEETEVSAVFTRHLRMPASLGLPLLAAELAGVTLPPA